MKRSFEILIANDMDRCTVNSDKGMDLWREVLHRHGIDTTWLTNLQVSIEGRGETFIPRQSILEFSERADKGLASQIDNDYIAIARSEPEFTILYEDALPYMRRMAGAESIGSFTLTRGGLQDQLLKLRGSQLIDFPYVVTDVMQKAKLMNSKYNSDSSQFIIDVCEPGSRLEVVSSYEAPRLVVVDDRDGAFEQMDLQTTRGIRVLRATGGKSHIKRQASIPGVIDVQDLKNIDEECIHELFERAA